VQNLETNANITQTKMASVEVPKKHKAAVYDKPGSISTKVEEIDTPEPGVGEVLVNL
jgi:alcohol dehydrogenase, propanol-preferring